MRLLLTYGLWIASLAFGWLQIVWWLLVPPVMYLVYTFSMTAGVEKRQQESGITSGHFKNSMFMPNIGLTLWNTLINSVLFGLAWLASSFVGGN